MTPEHQPTPQPPRNVNLAERTMLLEINRSKLILNWGLLPKDFQEEKYLITGNGPTPQMIVWLYTLRATPNLKVCEPAEVLKGVIIPAQKWSEILADARLIPSQRNPVRRHSRLSYLAPNLIRLDPLPKSPEIFQYKFSRNELTGNYGFGVTKTVELKFPNIS